MIMRLADLTVRVTESWRGGLVERRLEMSPATGGEPVVSLNIDEGAALVALMRRRIRDAVR
jgi:hypothetical protein